MACAIDLPEWPVRITHSLVVGPDPVMRFGEPADLWTAPGHPHPSLPHRGGGGTLRARQRLSLPPCGGGSGWGAALALSSASFYRVASRLRLAPIYARAAFDALRRHWPEYLMEAAGLGLFMVSAGLFGTLLFYPSSAAVAALPDPLIRQAIMGLIMGLTAIGLIYSPWGQQSGAHLNPAVTLTFWHLGKVATWDAVFYVLAQFAGGALGVLAVLALLGAAFADPPVSYVATVPGSAGRVVALIAEAAIAFGLMLTILLATNSPRLMRLTGVFAGCLVALYITFEAPLSGMSMNPARTLASALPGGLFDALWVYFVGPTVGMLLAVEAYRLIRHTPHVICAKLNHHTHRRCIFRCGYASTRPSSAQAHD